MRSIRQTLADLYSEHLYKAVLPFFNKRNCHRILIYHNIEKDDQKKFRDHVKFISDNFNILTANDLVDSLQSSNKKDQSCAITFDDGFSSIADFAVPILDAVGAKPTIFLNYHLFLLTEYDRAEQLKKFCRIRFPRLNRNVTLRGLTMSQILSLIANGYEFGTHTVSHRNLSCLSNNQIFFELRYPLNKFQFEFSYSCESFAYPYGRFGDFNETIYHIARRLNYKYGFSGISAPIIPGYSNPYSIPRTAVSFRWNFKYFQSIFSGSEDVKDNILRWKYIVSQSLKV
jgi:peptidoglycan/xylan/chitin deacetylase (PgdA/CDA1 family)